MRATHRQPIATQRIGRRAESESTSNGLLGPIAKDRHLLREKGTAVFDDVASSSLRVAVAGLSARQNAIANNISNIETPGYQARKVKFEEALSSAVAQGRSPSTVSPSVQNSLEPTRLNGSNVNLDEETLSHIDTTMRYQLTLRALDSKYGLLRDAIKGA